ncbi:proprotein convertase subtilisin/kexin type 5-like [Erinaceus europaeus]|uniref:Proprotein convertase subtilisin/kexin type 5-like n=1 Tax=Erinaceus europaeus TaxID=9365 RepID=A0ABM3Y6S0_ERIEU|nr:proprotein convertase subtilisin/kexin type 5-like [Erinaceus europaeus]
MSASDKFLFEKLQPELYKMIAQLKALLKFSKITGCFSTAHPCSFWQTEQLREESAFSRSAWGPRHITPFLGEYADEHGHCQPCDTSCSKCWGPTQKDCTGCPVSRFFDDGQCALNCPLGKFDFKDQCHPCHYTCQECQGNEPSNCTSCGTDKYGQERFLYQGECRERCPAGLYPAWGHTCLPCSDNCEICHSTDLCIRCRSGYFIVPTNHTCQKLECGQGEIQSPDYEGCVSCEEGCLGCSLDDPGTCTSCAVGYYIFEDHCYKTCPEKTYNEGFECKACDANCGNCDQDGCYWCEEGFFLLGGSCVRTCGPGFYEDPEMGECEPCHHACSTCTGRGYSQCSSCQEGLQLLQGTCVGPTQTQGEGHTWNELHVPTTSPSLVKKWQLERRRWKFQSKRDILEEHQQCHPSCKTCNGSATLCTSCLKGAYLLAQTCVPFCPQGTWSSVRSGSCENCTEGCASCSEANLCKKCGTQLDHPLVLHEGRCYSKCPAGFYTENGSCRHCSSSCRTCEGNATNCRSCAEDLVLDKGVCQKACSDRHVAMEGVCKPCPDLCESCIYETTCKECKGPGANNCTVCPANLVLQMDDNRCLHCCNASDPTNTQECCDCQETTDECILRENQVRPATEHFKTALFITSCVMLVLLLGIAVVVWKKSRGRVQAKKKSGYEKLADPSRSYSTYNSSHFQSTSYEEDQVVEYRDRDYDEDDEDDIVYMGQDGTVYRKFKYGLLDDDDEEELEYDDESYSYQ